MNDDLLIGAITGLLLGLGVLMILQGRPAGVSTAPRTYNNLEEWEFIKDGRGRVSGVKVHRHAESS